MQTIKIFLITLFLIGINCINVYTQSKIDYSIKSNILDPDTLKGDQKLVFDHFIKWTHKQADKIKPQELRDELESIGIKISNKNRFQKAFFFFDIYVIAHKKSVENWESFKDLAPGYKKPK